MSKKMYEVIMKIVGNWESVVAEVMISGVWHKKIEIGEELLSLVLDIWADRDDLYVSIAYYINTKKGLMRDPEIVGILDVKNKNFIPIHYRNEFTGYEKTYTIGSKEQRELDEICDNWAENIRFWGYVEGVK